MDTLNACIEGKRYPADYEIFCGEVSAEMVAKLLLEADAIVQAYQG